MQLAEQVISLCNSDSKLIYEELPVDDPKVRQPDSAKARKLLAWEPKIGPEEGLRRTIGYFKKRK